MARNQEHRFLKIGEKYQLQFREKRLFGFTAWQPYHHTLLPDISMPAEFGSTAEAIEKCRDLVRKGEVIPVIDTVTV